MTTVRRQGAHDDDLKAKISADPDEVARSVAALREDHEKADELEQLRSQTAGAAATLQVFALNPIGKGGCHWNRSSKGRFRSATTSWTATAISGC
ncbi:MAG TPA: hypothetical protein VF795_12160 [Desulfuromonadaceae bacterium]